jgi:hypothetical protein
MKLRSLWIVGQCPIATGIYYASGDITKLQIAQNGDQVAIAGRTTLDALLESDPDYLTDIDVIASESFRFNNQNLAAHCGGGSYGSEGFICLTQDFSPIWLAYFEASNPFMKIKLRRDKLHAVNNCREEWVIPISDPEKIVVDNRHSDNFLAEIRNSQMGISHDEFYKAWKEM